jgi:hypothetical protein
VSDREQADAFTVDVPLDEGWLVNALAAVRAGKIARVTVVIRNAGPKATYKARALGGGDAEYMVCSVAGDFTTEPAWEGR